MEKIQLPHCHCDNEELVVGSMPDAAACDETAEIFKQLSDGTRFRIFWMLCHLEECVSNIAAAMGMSNPAVSHHLKQLKSSGLIVSRREGKEVYYKLADTETAALVHKVCEEMLRITCPLEGSCEQKPAALVSGSNGGR